MAKAHKVARDTRETRALSPTPPALRPGVWDLPNIPKRRWQDKGRYESTYRKKLEEDDDE